MTGHDDGKCPYCDGTRERDSGGVYPWGEPIFVPCDCPEPPDLTLNEAEAKSLPYGVP